MRIQKTFISSKYLSMLCSGTVLMVLTAIMGIVDTLVAGIVLGEDAVTGICLVVPIYSLASFFAVFFSYGVPILYARKIGDFRKEEADRCFGVGLTAVSVIGLLMFVSILLGGDAYLRSFYPDGPVYEHAQVYLSWMKYAVLLLPLNELMDGMLFADGDDTVVLAANLSQGLLKVVLSAVLCRQMGAGGLALASSVSFAASVLISCLHFFRPGNTLKPNLAFSPAVLGTALKLGVVDASAHLFLSLFTAAFNLFVVKRFGEEMLVLVAVIMLLREGQIVFEGIGEAITPLISTYLGEGNYPGVRKIWKLARRSLWVESLLSTAFLLVGAPWIIGLLGIRDSETALRAVWALRMLSLTLVFTCRLYLDSSYFILVDRISLGVLDCLLRDLLPALPLAVLGGLIGGVYGMFIGLTAAPPLGYLLSLWFIKKRYGRENYPLFLADKEREKRVSFYEFTVGPEAITETRDELGAALRDNGIRDVLVKHVMLTFEELFMLIYDCSRGQGRPVLAECMVEIGDSVRMITKDNGQITDLTNPDQGVRSFRAYFFSNLVEAFTKHHGHFLALSYNRNVLEIR